MTWIKSNALFNHSQHSGPTVVFAGDGTSGGPPHYPPGVWNTVDLKPLGVTADAKRAELTGHLIITDLNPDIDNLTVTVRPPGSTLGEGNYQMQAVSVFSGDGARGAQSVKVALVNGCFQLYWQKTVAGVPENGNPSGFLLNLWLSEWTRDLPDASVDQSTAIASLQSAVTAMQAQIFALQQTPPPSSPPPDMTIDVPVGGLTVRLRQPA